MSHHGKFHHHWSTTSHPPAYQRARPGPWNSTFHLCCCSVRRSCSSWNSWHPGFMLAPITAKAGVGVLIHLPLQILIQYTGNYNWFNLHTCILLLPAWAGDFDESENAWERWWRRKGCKRAALLLFMVSLIHASTQLFPLSLTTPYKTALSRPDGFTITNRRTATSSRACSPPF